MVTDARLVRRRGLDGTVVEHDTEETQKLYGKPMNNHDIIAGNVRVPEAAHVLVREVAEIAPPGMATRSKH